MLDFEYADSILNYFSKPQVKLLYARYKDGNIPELKLKLNSTHFLHERHDHSVSCVELNLRVSVVITTLKVITLIVSVILLYNGR